MVSGRYGRMNCIAAVGVLVASLVLALGISETVLGAESPPRLGSFGPDGTEASDFANVGRVAVDDGTGSVYVGDSGKQTLYKFDESGNPVDFGGSAGYISGNEITGLSLRPDTKSEVAVDSDTHVIYVTSGDRVRAFEANGEPHEFTNGPGAGTSELPGAEELTGVAVDANGAIYTSDFSEGQNFHGKIRVYSQSGELLTEFTTFFDSTNLAVAPDGSVYVLSSTAVKFVPSSFPVTSTTTYTDEGPLDKNGAFSVAVDPTSGFVYVGQSSSGQVRVGVYDETGTFIGSYEGEAQGGELEGVPLGAAVYGAGERLYVAVVNESGPTTSKVEMFKTFVIPPLPPTITMTAATELTSSSATLRGRVNPNTLETTYRFEYGTEHCSNGPNACTVVLPEGTIGTGHNPVSVARAISGLASGTKYYYRLVAENALGITEGPVRAFTTQKSLFGFKLSDERTWEQVSPINKFGGVITNGALAQAAADGSGIAFMSRGSIVSEPAGNRALEASANLARRENGWHVEDLVPAHTESTGAGFGPEYKLFSRNLERAVFEPRDETRLSPEASERTPYLRSNTMPPGLRPLVTSEEGFANVPPGTVFGGEVNGDRSPVSFSGGNDDLTHLVISSKAPLVAGAPSRAIYIWVDGKLKPVSELPAGEGGEMVLAKLGSGLISTRHAVSEDGSRVFWSPGEIGGGSLEIPALYLRDTETEESIRLDVVQPGATGSGQPSPVYMGASSDGRFVFFTDGQQLTEDASPGGRDLYRCEIGVIGESLGCTEIIDLSAPRTGSGESAEALELSLGMSDDGTRLYFVAEAVLDTEANEAGETAVMGSPNLYLWQEGEGVRFVAPLSTRDAADWGRPGEPGASPVAHASRLAAAGSPNGRYVAFMSERNLTGGESNDPQTGEPTEQAFFYDAVTERLVCVSCNPSGATDAGHLIPSGESEGGGVFPDVQGLWAGRWVSATLPEGTEGEPTIGYSFYRPRAVLDNGRVFFNSVAPLVSVDSNGTWDVYQYEPFGVGSCTPVSASASTSVAEDGCISLISSGADKEPSVFLDASESGDDIFFLTYARLSALDTDDIVDVYDARVNGVAAVAEQNPECLGEACRSPASSPDDTSPGSAVFSGAGNVKTNPGKHCHRGFRKVHRKGKVRCVRRKHGHHSGRGGKHGRARR